MTAAPVTLSLIPKTAEPPYCSFCGLPKHETETLFASTREGTYICNTCVDRCHDQLHPDCWHPIVEPPPEDVDVLVFCPANNVSVDDAHCRIAFMFNGVLHDVNGPISDGCHPTHWMLMSAFPVPA